MHARSTFRRIRVWERLNRVWEMRVPNIRLFIMNERVRVCLVGLIYLLYIGRG